MSALGVETQEARANRSTNKPPAERSLCGGFGRGDGICAFGGAPSSEQGELRGRPPLANTTLSAPAPPFPANLLLRKIFAGALPSAHRAVQFAPIRYVSEQFARKPLALRSRLHPQIPSMFVKTGKRADESQLSFPWSRRRDLNPRPLGPEPSALPNCATPRTVNIISNRTRFCKRF